MIRHGTAPFLECSSRGDKRFSAFSAQVKRYGGETIEAIYQGKKRFADGSTGLGWREAKGRRAVNQEECAAWYAHLWDQYIYENPHLLDVLRSVSGLSDVFGQPGHCCQATELWRIRSALPVNLKSERFDVRIDRETKWGNPFVIGRDGNRQAVIEQYARHIRTRPDLMAALPELRGKRLGCHCAPLSCHGDVLVALVLEMRL